MAAEELALLAETSRGGACLVECSGVGFWGVGDEQRSEPCNMKGTHHK